MFTHGAFLWALIMATAKNDITGDSIASIPTKQYADNYDAIFRKDKPVANQSTSTLEDEENEKHATEKYGPIRQGQ